ncbi:hypothetical protein M0813_17691 [Anaeramoeba flamelloides]|uniref:Uncharacterized protein n=1 Tax=Anaeramoeba flamelloides TaxID=1746091 RepID=A0ABQ8YUS1_9EUKA|nr:hypothetical protein M0813_17691 [Anaeramoeba flamelloides]
MCFSDLSFNCLTFNKRTEQGGFRKTRAKLLTTCTTSPNNNPITEKEKNIYKHQKNYEEEKEEEKTIKTENEEEETKEKDKKER